MSPLPTDEVRPELGPSLSLSQGNTAPPLSHVIEAMYDLVIYLRKGFGDKSRDHTDVQSLNLMTSCHGNERPPLNLKFDQIMFNSLVFTWERDFEVMFSIVSVLIFQISVLESYLDIYLF